MSSMFLFTFMWIVICILTSHHSQDIANRFTEVILHFKIKNDISCHLKISLFFCLSFEVAIFLFIKLYCNINESLFSIF